MSWEPTVGLLKESLVWAPRTFRGFNFKRKSHLSKISILILFALLIEMESNNMEGADLLGDESNEDLLPIPMEMERLLMGEDSTGVSEAIAVMTMREEGQSGETTAAVVSGIVKINNATTANAVFDPGISAEQLPKSVWKKWQDLTAEEKKEKNKRTNAKKKQKRMEEKARGKAEVRTATVKPGTSGAGAKHLLLRRGKL
jgi:hypothetical protein